MYLLDTNVVSELRRPKPHGAVLAWMAAQQSETLFLSAMTIAELQRGIEITREQDPARADALENWLLYDLLPNAQVLPMDTEVSRIWAKLVHKRSNTLFEDAWFAATAICHRLQVVSRNSADFFALGVACLDPFADGPI